MQYFKGIKKNKFKVKAMKSTYYDYYCRATDAFPCSFENKCINVHSRIECSPKLCPANEKCLNQNFHRGKQFSLQVNKTDSKGWGLFAGEDILATKFIIEYIGEVINDADFQHRFNSNKDKNFYFMKLEQNVFIDATKYGNESRYINHSCNPNAVLNKWIVHSNDEERTRIGVFALRKIYAVYLAKNVI